MKVLQTFNLRTGCLLHTLVFSSFADSQFFLHEDHLHYSPSSRITHYHLLIMFLISGGLMTWSLYDGAILLEQNYFPIYVWVGIQSLASILLAVLFIRHTVFPSDNWHRMPMFYDRLIESND